MVLSAVGSFKQIAALHPALVAELQSQEKDKELDDATAVPTRPTAPTLLPGATAASNSQAEQKKGGDMLSIRVEGGGGAAGAVKNKAEADGSSAIELAATPALHPPPKAAPKALIASEDRVAGSISSSLYRYYADSACDGYGTSRGLWLIAGLIVVCALNQVCRMGGDLWLATWGARPNDASTTFWLVGLALFAAATSVFSFGRAVYLTAANTAASRALNDRLFERVLRAPVNLFFDVTPVGRILNRFSKGLHSHSHFESFIELGFNQCL